MLTCPHPPPVTVIFDPTDDVGHLRAALAAHNPRAGRITIHPTAGLNDLDILACNVLAALDVPVPLPLSDGTPDLPDRAGLTAAAWLMGYGITHLTVLRAHLLPAIAWRALLQLRTRTGLHLSTVCHRPTLGRVAERALADVECRYADAAAVLPARGAPRRRRPTPPAPTRKWITLAALTHLPGSRSMSSPGHCRCTTPPPPPPGSAPAHSFARQQEIASRLKTATANPAAAAALAVAVCTAAGSDRLATCQVTDLSTDGNTLILHDPDQLGRSCRSHFLLPWTRPLVQAARFLRLMAPSTTAPLFADPFDNDRLPDLPRLAEAGKLRPPQPPGRRRHPVWTGTRVRPRSGAVASNRRMINPVG